MPSLLQVESWWQVGEEGCVEGDASSSGGTPRTVRVRRLAGSEGVDGEEEG